MAGRKSQGILAASVVLAAVMVVAVPAVAGAQTSNPPEGMHILFDTRAGDSYGGVVLPQGIGFSALRVGEENYDLRIDLPNGKVVIARVDYGASLATVRVQSVETGEVVPLERADLDAFEHLSIAIDGTGTAEGTAASVGVFLRILNWLTEAPPGMMLDLTVELDAEQLRAIRSLCSKIGQKVKATYDIVAGGPYTKRVKVGPCMRGDCMGRCGQGCGGGVGWRKAIQQMTQDCLNHDVCVDIFGYITPSCQDEFAATLDDAASAPDCNAIKGNWTFTFATKPVGFSKDFKFTTTDPTTGNAVFKGKAVTSGRTASFNGTRGAPFLIGVKVKIPLWMTGDCAGTTAGFATAGFRGIAACGKVSGRLKKGKWTRFSTPSCTLIKSQRWSGKVTGARNDMPGSPAIEGVPVASKRLYAIGEAEQKQKEEQEEQR